MNDRPERHQRYIAGICIDCGLAPHSPGRPRCAECHTGRVHVFEPGLSRREKKRKAG